MLEVIKNQRNMRPCKGIFLGPHTLGAFRQDLVQKSTYIYDIGKSYSFFDPLLIVYARSFD